jgi:RecA/RadA recombinase
MALRAKKPEAIEKRLKLFLFGPAGVGKTTAAIQFPKSYVIDCERGAENYAPAIAKSGSVLFQTTNIGEIITEVKSLLTEKHDYRTLVIDPITPAYADLLDLAEQKVGSDFGRHYGEANKQMKRLTNLLMALDMNVILTAHAKAEYGPKLEKIGVTFDGWKRLDYLFDLVLRLDKHGKSRTATVVKSRLATFPDQESFDWSYEAMKERAGDVIEREAQALTLATAAQVGEIKRLLDTVKLPEGTVEKWFSKAGVETWEDMPTDIIGKCIEAVGKRMQAGKGNGDE